MARQMQSAISRMSAKRQSTPKTPAEEEMDRLNLPTRHRPVFVDSKAMKEKLRENMHKPRYDVTNFYKTEGMAQAIARDNRFENITLSVISFNALWIAIDCDSNDAEVLHQADPVFIVAENFFCLFFSFELCMRFLAFRRKADSMRDAWFCFDAFMVFLMILETWIMTAVLLIMGGSEGSGGGLGNASLLRLLRLMRLSRMARMARLLRAMPELLILIKGMVAAIRSVFFTLLLLMLLLYVYAIAFRQLTADSVVGTECFPTIIISMNRLVLDGILFDGPGDLLVMMQEEEQYILIFVFYFFVLLAALTVMNMLIGVLCEVVSAVAETEHEQLTILYVRDRLEAIVKQLAFNESDDGEILINKESFLEILGYPDSARLLNEVQVNVFGLVDLVDTIFASESGKEKVLSFADLVETMLDQRETNTATVKDVTDLRKYVRGRVDRLETLMEAHMLSLGRLMEKSNGLAPGAFEAELIKCRQEMDFDVDTPEEAVLPPPVKPAVMEQPPQLLQPKLAGMGDESDDGSAAALTGGSSGNAMVIGRSGGPPPPADKPERLSSQDSQPERLSSQDRVAQTPERTSNGCNEDSSDPMKDGSKPPVASTKKRFQKKKAALTKSTGDIEKAPLAANVDSSF